MSEPFPDIGAGEGAALEALEDHALIYRDKVVRIVLIAHSYITGDSCVKIGRSPSGLDPHELSQTPPGHQVFLRKQSIYDEQQIGRQRFPNTLTAIPYGNSGRKACIGTGKASRGNPE